MNSSLDKTDRMASENPASADGNVPTGSKMTTLCIKKGASVDVLKTHDPIEFGDDVKTTTQLRTILVGKGVMVEGDQFVGKDGSLLKRDLEGSTQWSDLVAEEVFQVVSAGIMSEPTRTNLHF
jgi:hypothetical protein